MFIFKIDRKLKLGEHNSILEYRKIVTPLFYKKLKTRVYTFTKSKRNYLTIPIGISFITTKLPKGDTILYTEFKTIEDKDVGYNTYYRLKDFLDASR